MGKQKNQSDDGARHWAFLVFQESAPEDWENIISSQFITWARSPLHDKDIWTADDPHFDPDKYQIGDLKKPHWHVFLDFPGKKTYNGVLKMLSGLNIQYATRVQSANGYIQYFVHLNNPEKAQYRFEDIKCFNGFDVTKYFMPTGDQLEKILIEMHDFIERENILEYADFEEYARRNEPIWHKLIMMSKLNVISSYIKSRSYSYRLADPDGVVRRVPKDKMKYYIEVKGWVPV